MKLNIEMHKALIENITSELLRLNDHNVMVSYTVSVYNDQTCALCADVEGVLGNEHMITESVYLEEKMDEFLENVEKAKKTIIKARREAYQKERDRLLEQVANYDRVLLRMEDTYEGRQAWWEYKNNVELGTKVKAVRTYVEGEGGYCTKNNGNFLIKEGLLNEVGTVADIGRTGVIVEFDGKERVELPFFILQIVKE